MGIVIVDRLTEQLRDKGVADPERVAVERLKQYGVLTPDGRLTALGWERNAMTPADRAIDRAVQRGSHAADEYQYDPGTNRATLKGRRAKAGR